MAKDWDQHVLEAEDLARTEGFQRLRDEIVRLAAPRADDVAVDIGAGTGLLTLALAPSVEKVWAIDVSPAMIEYLTTKAASGEMENVEAASASAISLPLVDGAANLAVSNYCFHHLPDADKVRALHEVFRVLRPGGRVVIGDMMFRVSAGDPRSRRILVGKIRAILTRGPAGVVRVLKNALRFVTGRWEHPADAGWWRRALKQAGFGEVTIHLLEHEGGIITASRPDPAARRRRWRSAAARRPDRLVGAGRSSSQGSHAADLDQVKQPGISGGPELAA